MTSGAPDAADPPAVDPRDAEFDKVDREIGRGTAAISTIAGGAALGAALGPETAAVGAAVGALVGVVPVIYERMRRRGTKGPRSQQ